jgi:hypothetical protein
MAKKLQQLNEEDYDVLVQFLDETVPAVDGPVRRRLEVLTRRMAEFRNTLREDRLHREKQAQTERARKKREEEEAPRRLAETKQQVKDALLAKHSDEAAGPWLFFVSGFNGESTTAEEYAGINTGTWRDAVEEAVRRWPPDMFSECGGMNGAVRIRHAN